MSFLEGGSYLDKFRSFEMLLKEFIYRAEHLFQNRLIPWLHALKNDACSLFRRTFSNEGAVRGNERKESIFTSEGSSSKVALPTSTL